MSLMFPWATREYLLDKMSLEQISYYYNKGWEAKQTEAKVHWGTYGQLMSGSNEKTQTTSVKRSDIDELRQYPGYKNAYYDENGKFHRE